MNHWICALLIVAAGALGGVVNSLLTDNRFILPQWKRGIFCPGFLSNVLIGAFAAFASWAFYGSGASIDLARPDEQVQLRLSAVAGAFLVGVVGARWITNESEKQLFQETATVVAEKKGLTPEECAKLIKGPARHALAAVEQV